jgi:hypothetical protein
MAVLEGLSAHLKRNRYVLLLAFLAVVCYVGWIKPARAIQAEHMWFETNRVDLTLDRGQYEQCRKRALDWHIEAGRENLTNLQAGPP